MSLYEMVPDGFHGGSDVTDNLITWVQAPSVGAVAEFKRKISFEGDYYKIMDNPPDDLNGVDFVIDELGEIIDRRA